MGNIVSGHDLISRMGHDDVFGTHFPYSLLKIVMMLYKPCRLKV